MMDQRAPRYCDITGTPMFDGWVWWHGEMYTATLETTLAQLRDDRKFVVQKIDRIGPKHLEEPDRWDEFQILVQKVLQNTDTDEDLLEIAFQLGMVYWTEWHDEPEEDWHEPPYRIEKKI